MIGIEGRFPFISRLDVYIVETPANVKFCEVPGSTELGDKFGNEKEGILVLDDYSIQCTIVLN